MVDVGFVENFHGTVSLETLKATKGLEQMMVTRKGSRLSIQPVTKAEYDIVHTKITTKDNTATFHIAVSGKAGKFNFGARIRFPNGPDEMGEFATATFLPAGVFLTAAVVADLLLQMHAQQKTIMIVVTHSEALGARFARRWQMQRGVLSV